jgi:hypothetical protein
MLLMAKVTTRALRLNELGDFQARYRTAFLGVALAPKERGPNC